MTRQGAQHMGLRAIRKLSELLAARGVSEEEIRACLRGAQYLTPLQQITLSGMVKAAQLEVRRQGGEKEK